MSAQTEEAEYAPNHMSCAAQRGKEEVSNSLDAKSKSKACRKKPWGKTTVNESVEALPLRSFAGQPHAPT